jgi:prenylcysteine oxidase/farnesylcysteine lyase
MGVNVSFHYRIRTDASMETQTLSAREAVARVAQRWWGIGPGECREGKGWDLTCAEV